MTPAERLEEATLYALATLDRPYPVDPHTASMIADHIEAAGVPAVWKRASVVAPEPNWDLSPADAEEALRVELAGLAFGLQQVRAGGGAQAGIDARHRALRVAWDVFGFARFTAGSHTA